MNRNISSNIVILLLSTSLHLTTCYIPMRVFSPRKTPSILPPLKARFSTIMTTDEQHSTSLTSLDHPSLAELCDSIGASMPTSPLLLTTPTHSTTKKISNHPNSPEVQSERGLITTSPIPRNSPILMIPLSSCLSSDSPPSWLFPDDDDDQHHLHNPSNWHIHLAASFLNSQSSPTLQTWRSLLPSPSYLRSSLPVHWSDDSLSKARCCALELTVDSAYFSRAEAIEALLSGLKQRNHAKGTTTDNDVDVDKEEEDDDASLAKQCHYALDIVQTRTARVDRLNGLLRPPLRLLAPIFDFMNHGGTEHSNAYFRLEESDDETTVLMVRAERDIREGEEILLDYGESARPKWKCMANYGFVPDFEEEDEDVAEVFMGGVRYEVGSSTVPFEMVEAAADTIQAENGVTTTAMMMTNGDAIRDGENPLTAAVALRIARRVSDVAFDLLLVSDDDGEGNESVAEIQAASLAARLRWNQHRVLMACAMGLRDYASQNMGFDKE